MVLKNYLTMTITIDFIAKKVNVSQMHFQSWKKTKFQQGYRFKEVKWLLTVAVGQRGLVVHGKHRIINNLL